MRIITLLTFLILFLATKVNAYNELDFKRHTFEVSVTPCFDYHFVTRPKVNSSFSTNIKNMDLPYIGYNLGVAYIYRPIKFIGFSTGVNNLEYTTQMGKKVYPASLNFPSITVQYKGFTSDWYIGVPVFIHAYCRINKTELDWATGPEFLFAIYSIYKYSATPDNAFLGGSDNFTQKYSAYDAVNPFILVWVLQLSANIPIKKCFDLSIGPEVDFFPVNNGEATNYPDAHSPNEIDFYLGIKVGFPPRFQFL